MELVIFTKACQRLSHSLRVQIFWHLVKEGQTEVKQIASVFDIHPNLARDHLDKLEELELAKSKFVKQERGAPLKSYRANTTFICLNYPECPLKKAR